MLKALCHAEPIAVSYTHLDVYKRQRQYCVLDDPTLARVYQNQRQRYSQMLDAHAGVLPLSLIHICILVCCNRVSGSARVNAA